MSQCPITGKLATHCLVVRLAVWLLTLLIFPLPVTSLPLSFCREVLRLEFHAPAPIRRMDAQHLIAHTLAYLQRAELHEADPWLRDDIRQAWIALSTFERGQHPSFASAWVAASYRMYGLHPAKLFAAVCERRRALLGKDYARFY